MSHGAPPVADDELPALFAGLAGAASVGVAVSGGPDSTALLHLLDRHIRSLRHPPRLHVLTVDHGLRAGSDRDAAAVVAYADALGLPATRLAWDHDGAPPAADIQAAARDARYALLAAEARRAGLDVVALGHTLDDKAETLLIRLARGSGLSGLAAMPAEREIHGVRFVRPLLPIPKARLMATLRAAGLGWIDDPSNADTDRFLRARVRALIPSLAGIGLDAARLAATADRLAQADAAIGRMEDEVAARALVDHGGVASIDLAAVAAAPSEIAMRLIVRAHRLVRPAPHPPRASVLDGLLADLRPGRGELTRRTTGGVVLDPVAGRLWLYAEAGRKGFPELVVSTPGTHLWDGRFEVSVPLPPPAPFLVGPARGEERRADLPARAAASLPMLRSAGNPVPAGVSIRPVTQV